MRISIFGDPPDNTGRYNFKDKNRTVHENLFFSRKKKILQELRYLRAHWELGVHIWGPYWIYVLFLENKLFFSRSHFFSDSDRHKIGQNSNICPKADKNLKILITENSKPTRSAGHDARYVIDMSRPPQCVILIQRYIFLVQTKILATSSSIEDEPTDSSKNWNW